MNIMARNTTLTLLFAAGAALAPTPASAHCDSMDGPVVKAAQQALALNQVERVLVWVRAEDEAAIRDAFDRTVRVRAMGDDAQEMADRWFFETLVRIHRAGEGAPYTGLKPAGSEAPGGIAAADHALVEGSVDVLAEGVAKRFAHAIEERFAKVQALKDHDATDVDAGRRYVHAYVDFIHFVEAAHELAHREGGEHGAEAEAAGHAH